MSPEIIVINHMISIIREILSQNSHHLRKMLDDLSQLSKDREALVEKLRLQNGKEVH